MKISQFVLEILSGNVIFTQIKGHNSGTNVQKTMCNDSELDLVNMNAYIEFGENQSTCSRDIEWKRNFGVNQGP